MKFIELFIRLPEPKNVIIDDVMIEKYKSLCNHGRDSHSSAFQRIIKGISLGKLVYQYKDKAIYRYFNVNYQCIDMGNRLILENIWRSTNQYKVIKVSEVKKKIWNRKYGLTSHYGVKTVNEDGSVNE